MGIKVDPEEYDRWVREGLVEADPKPRHGTCDRVHKRKKKSEFVPSCHLPPGTWLVGVETYSLANKISIKAGMKWKRMQKDATMLAMGKNHASLVAFADLGIHAGLPIKVNLCRLGGRSMDDDNLSVSMKYLRDAVADMLGTKDNNPLIKWTYSQQKNDRLGVKIEITKS